MTSAGDWIGRVGNAWAAEWKRTDRSFADLGLRFDQAIHAIAPVDGRALDVGSGAGTTSLVLAGVRPGLAITAIDLSPTLVAIAMARKADVAARVNFRCGDVLTLLDGEALFDLIVSRHGLMFFADPVMALARLHAAARPGAFLIFSCFAERSANAFATLADTVTSNPPATDPAPRPGPFAFADRDRVAAWLAQAGWRDATATRVTFDYVAGEGSDPVADAVAFLSRIGPAARAIADAPPEWRHRLIDRLARAVEARKVGSRILLPATAWLWHAVA